MTYTDAKLERTMALIANLIARANHPNTPPAEAELCRMQADKLMAKHRIEESELDPEQRAARGVKVANMYWWVFPYDVSDDADLRGYFYRIADYIAEHVGAKYVTTTKRDDTGRIWVVCHVFGFESDLAFGSLLINAATQAYGEHMFPKPNPGLSDEENVFRMRSAGMERNRIAAALWGSDMKDGKAHGKVAVLYRKTAVAKGEDPTALMGKGNNMRVYRVNYAHGFTSTLRSRLMVAKSSAGNGELVLMSRDAEVSEAFYAVYPYLRPASVDPNAKYEPCQRCKAAKSGYCREHRPRRVSYIKSNAAAQERGRDAARRVELSGGTQAVEG